MRRRRVPILSLGGAVLAGCSVVPDPTSGGLEGASDSSARAVVGSWMNRATTSTSVAVRRLTLSKGLWYQRWTTDSAFTTGLAQTTLLEQGSWNWMPGDSARLVLVPSFRQVGSLVAANQPDTVRYAWFSDSIQWVSHRDSLDTLYWHPG